MPVRESQSSILGKNGSRLTKTLKEHKSDPVDYADYGDLPAGIIGGVAQLASMRIGVFKSGKHQGKPGLFATGMVKRPDDCYGMYTRINEPLYDTPDMKAKTFEDHVINVIQILKKLGVEEENIGSSESELNETIRTLVDEVKPHFRFRTEAGKEATEGQYKGRPAMIFHRWGAQCPWEEGGVVEHDRSAAAAMPNGSAEEPEAGEGGTELSEDLDELASSAAEGNEDAKDRLREIAVETGVISEEEIDNAESWSDVADMIRNTSTEGSNTEGEDGEALPNKGDIFKIQLRDPRTKAPAVHPRTKKPILTEVSVISVDKKAGTATVKNLETGKPVAKPIPLDELK